MTDESFAANVGDVYPDGVSLILPGSDSPTSKHYRGNASVGLKAGDRVKVTRIGSSYLVDYKIGVQGGAAPENTGKDYSNPNLLDNWYFVKPINQRGISSSGATTYNVYGLDRWKWNYGSKVGSYELTAAGLKVIPANTDERVIIMQPLEYPEVLDGRTITASVLTEQRGLISGTITRSADTNQAFYSTGSVRIELRSSNTIWYMFDAADTVVAAKLELGDQQTLAHLENGAWVLNEIPDYGEQLRRCQRFCRVTNWNNANYAQAPAVAVSSNVARAFLPFAGMRARPTITPTSGEHWRIYKNGQLVTPDSIAPYAASVNGLVLTINASGLTYTEALYFTSYSGTNVVFSADL